MTPDGPKMAPNGGQMARNFVQLEFGAIAILAYSLRIRPSQPDDGPNGPLAPSYWGERAELCV
jgi:hypothetical protein